MLMVIQWPMWILSSGGGGVMWALLVAAVAMVDYCSIGGTMETRSIAQLLADCGAFHC